MRIISMAVLLLGVGAMSANAQMTVKKYQDWVKAAHDSHNTEEIRVSDWYIDGIGQGIQIMNIWMKDLHEKDKLTFPSQVYCTPGQLILHAENYRDLVDSFVVSVVNKPEWRKGDDPLEMPISFALQLSLMDAFPCDKDTK